MNSLLRLVAASGLALWVLAAPVSADSLLAGAASSVTGSYLAGEQAMGELRTDDAAQFFRDAMTDEWDNPLVLAPAYMAFAADGQISEAAGAARHLLELDQGDDMARLIVATEAVKQRRYDAAIRDLDKIGQDSFEGITGAILKAWALTGNGKVDDAFKALDHIADGGLEEFVIFHRAIMADVSGREPDAIDFITKAHDGDPYTADVVEAYARILGNAGRYTEALGAIGDFEAQGLSYPTITAVKDALANKQRPGLYADSVQAGAAEMFHSVGVALARDGTNDVALVLMRLASYLDPKNDTISLVVGQLYDAAGQHELANGIYDAIPDSSVLKPMAVVRVANNLDALGNRTQALRRLENIVTSNPDDLDAVSVLGDLLRSDKQYAAAADAYTKALRISGGEAPGDWRFYYVRGISYERSGQFPLAEKDFLKALDLNPGQPQVLNYLGYSWVDKGVNLNRALDMIKRAVKGSPNDGYIIDSLGWAYYRLGRYADAVTELEQAATLRPNDPEINDHLGDAYWRVGRRLEAHFQWNVAYSLDTEGDVKKRIEPKLKGGLDAAPKTPDSAPVEDVPGDQAQVH